MRWQPLLKMRKSCRPPTQLTIHRRLTTAPKEKVDATFSDIANTPICPELGQFRAAIAQMNRSNEHTDDDADSAMNAPIHANDDDDDIGDVHGFDDDGFDNDDNEIL